MFDTNLRRALTLTATLLTLTAVASTQSTLRIRLLDGKSSKALAPASIRIATTPAETPRYLIPAADPASVLVYLKSAQTFTVSDQFKRCDIDQTAPKDQAAQQAAAPATYAVADILAHGLVSANTCAKPGSSFKPAAPKPGELVLYVRRATPCEISKDHINGINFCK